MIVTIAFDSNRIDNFEVLPQGHTVNGVTFRFTHNPEVDIVGDKVTTNFDYLITDGEKDFFDTHMLELLDPKQVKLLPRSGKHVQFVRQLNYKRNGYHCSGMIVPKSYHSVTNNTLRHFIKDPGCYVIKPFNGARGIGQFKINTDKMPIRILLNTLHSNYDSVDSAGSMQKILEDLKPWKDAFAYSTSGERSEGEGIAILMNGFFIQEHIDNITEEYRIITDYKSDISYVQRRGFKYDETNSYQQAIGSELTPSDIGRLDNLDHLKYKDEIVTFIKTVVDPMNSVDLFIREDGTWGIFEWCNQFGTMGIPSEIVTKIHEDFLLSLLPKTTGSIYPRTHILISTE